MKKVGFKKKWTVISIVILLLFVSFYFFGSLIHIQQVKKGVLNVEGQPTLGSEKALVQVVAFQEPKCGGCKTFMLEVFPKIKKEFIDTNLIRYTIIPVSFLPGSMLSAASWLCVCAQDKQNKEKTFAFITAIYKSQPPEEEYKQLSQRELKTIAERVDSSIDLETIFNSKKYENQVKRNTAYAMKMMEGEVFTPALYVDGLFVEDLDYSDIENAINKALGVY